MTRGFENAILYKIMLVLVLSTEGVFEVWHRQRKAAQIEGIPLPQGKTAEVERIKKNRQIQGEIQKTASPWTRQSEMKFC